MSLLGAVDVPDGYTYVSDLPNGFLGRSIIVEHNGTHEKFVCKMVEHARIGAPELVDEFITYVTKLKDAKMQFIQPFTDIHNAKEQIYLIRPFIEMFPLPEHLTEEDPEPNQLFLYWKLIIKAVEYLHSIGLAPNFLKPSNIFVGNGHIVLTDLYPPLHDVSMCFKQCDPFEVSMLAPEYFTGSPAPCAKSDIWSLGIMLFYLMTSDSPFNLRNMFSMIQQITKGKDGFSKPVHASIEKIINATCVIDPDQRTSCEWLSEQRPAGELPARTGAGVPKIPTQLTGAKKLASPRAHTQP